MICLTPVQIKSPHITGDRYLMVPCKKCTTCLKKRASGWTFRLKQELKIATTSAFITYTYEDSQLPRTEYGMSTLHPKHHTIFMKRLRKLVQEYAETAMDLTAIKPIKYYMVGEYGSETERPHYHSIIFNIPQHLLNNPHHLEKAWEKGMIQIDKVSSASIAYVCGYVNKQTHFEPVNENDTRIPEFSRMSKHLGENFLTEARIKQIKSELEPTITIEGGQKIAMPDYYKNKVLTKRERRLISDKIKIHISENPTFKNEKHHHDYVKNEAIIRERNSKKRNKI